MFYQTGKGRRISSVIEIEKGNWAYAHVYRIEMWNLGQNK